MASGNQAGDRSAGLAEPAPEKVSDELERWLRGDQPKTLGGLIEVFGERGFAIAFVLLMALPALPLPTGGATHVLEIVTVLLALELIAGRREIWLPERFKGIELAGGSREKFINAVLRRIRWFERFSRPRGQRLLGYRLTRVLFGLAVVVFTVAAFLAPPFSGLDTLPSLGVVMLGLGILMSDAALAGAGVVVGVLGVVTVIGLGSLVAKAVGNLF